MLSFFFASSNSSQFQFAILIQVKHIIRLSKSVSGIFHFRFHSVFIKFYVFCSTQCFDSLSLTRHNLFQNEKNRKATHNFASRSLIFKLQWEVLKFKGIFLSWSFLKLTLAINFLKLEKRSVFLLISNF